MRKIGDIFFTTTCKASKRFPRLSLFFELMQKETFDTLKKIFLLKILLRVLEYAMGIM